VGEAAAKVTGAFGLGGHHTMHSVTDMNSGNKEEKIAHDVLGRQKGLSESIYQEHLSKSVEKPRELSDNQPSVSGSKLIN
jgi:hypothetical protein